eukprot:scaffold173289_cov34-Prasinocladus_malaysianus.AAC.1
MGNTSNERRGEKAQDLFYSPWRHNANWRSVLITTGGLEGTVLVRQGVWAGCCFRVPRCIAPALRP